MAKNGIKCMLVDNKKSVNILFWTTYDKTLAVETKIPLNDSLFLEFLILDHRLAYHSVLG